MPGPPTRGLGELALARLGKKYHYQPGSMNGGRFWWRRREALADHHPSNRGVFLVTHCATTGWHNDHLWGTEVTLVVWNNPPIYLVRLLPRLRAV